MNAKVIKEYDEWAERQRGKEQVDDEADKLLIKYARVASGATVRWKRKVAENADSHVEEQTAEQKQDDQGCQRKKGGYNRMLTCMRCNQPQETKWMQLRTPLGYRAIHCT